MNTKRNFKDLTFVIFSNLHLRTFLSKNGQQFSISHFKLAIFEIYLRRVVDGSSVSQDTCSSDDDNRKTQLINICTDMWGRYANAAARLESKLPDMAYCRDELEAPSYRHFRIIYIEDVQICRVRGRPRIVYSYEATAIVSLTRKGKLLKAAVGELGGGITRILCCSWSVRRTRTIADCGVDSYGKNVAMPVWIAHGPYEERSFCVLVDVTFGLRQPAGRRVAAVFLLFFVLVSVVGKRPVYNPYAVSTSKLTCVPP
ncbi:Uncharacterized protein FWK35_00009266 [Aphis craccivora]|uniref:Uncharacterized protein n=1 Tax=Aphis craccivora TaxID=307492 RepID=A0A6G0ZDX8_APHCR|nr:Uncharacterized protein FWK35_00009266 [Aphis craccivora]